jgi:hypothetical protein
MKIAFEKQCECLEIEATYPKPSISTRAPTAGDVFAYVEIAFHCPICAKPWSEMIADNFCEKTGSKIGSKLIIAADAALASEQKHTRLIKFHA